MQLAMAFWYGISTYLKSLFEESRRIVSVVYISSLLLCLYIAVFKGSYLLSIVGIAL